MATEEGYENNNVFSASDGQLMNLDEFYVSADSYVSRSEHRDLGRTVPTATSELSMSKKRESFSDSILETLEKSQLYLNANTNLSSSRGAQVVSTNPKSENLVRPPTLPTYASSPPRAFPTVQQAVRRRQRLLSPSEDLTDGFELPP